MRPRVFLVCSLLVMAISAFAAAAEIKVPQRVKDREPIVAVVDAPADTENQINIVEWELGALRAHFHDNDREACLWPPGPGEFKISALVISLTKEPFSYRKTRVGAVVIVEGQSPNPPIPGPGPGPTPDPEPTDFKAKIQVALGKVPAANRANAKQIAQLYRALVAEVSATNGWDAAQVFNERKQRITTQLSPQVLAVWAPYFVEEAKAFAGLGITAGDVAKACGALLDAASVLEAAQ